MKYVIVFVLFLAVMSVDSFARQQRVTQVPNGGKFGCKTCHTGFGGPRNDFGIEIENNYLDGSGNVIWGPALAALDSDNDTKTNGEELQDPTGSWVIGEANPGDASLVSNPGDPESTVGVAIAAFGLPSSFTLKQNYPNPFNPSTTISFTVPTNSTVTLRVYNSLGQPIRDLVDGNMQPGEYSFLCDGQDKAGEVMGSGIYLVRLTSEGVDQTIRMLMMK